MDGTSDRVDPPARRRRRSLHRKLGLGAVVVAVLLAIAYAAAFHGVKGESATHDSGVRGTVVRVPLDRANGSGAPAAADGEPAAAVVMIENSHGRRLSTVTSDYSGRFTADLPPGEYLISAMTPVDTALPVSQPFGIVVRAHHYTEVRLVLPATVGPEMGGSPGALPE
jgi:hypothetical protein